MWIGRRDLDVDLPTPAAQFFGYGGLDALPSVAIAMGQASGFSSIDSDDEIDGPARHRALVFPPESAIKNDRVAERHIREAGANGLASGRVLPDTVSR